MEPRVLPPVYFMGAGVTMVLLDEFAPVAGIPLAPWTTAGQVVIVAGALLTVIAAFMFKRAGTPLRPFEESTTLVRGGPFRFSRNPMYLGMILMLVGLWLLLGSWSPVVVVPAFVVLIRNLFVLPEEQVLEMQFRTAYLDYKRRVRRWI